MKGAEHRRLATRAPQRRRVRKATFYFRLPPINSPIEARSDGGCGGSGTKLQIVEEEERGANRSPNFAYFSAMRATREQLIAQSADRHLAVVANAGSGKTAVLVERYVHLLLAGVDVRAIVAITFTRKAAAEMMKRVAEKLEGILADPRRREEWPRIKRIRERLNTARISTIHSFCARLLRDFPIEAGVNPGFTEMTEYESAALKRDAMMTAMERWLEAEEEDADKRATILALLRRFGRAGSEALLGALMAAREPFLIARAAYEEHSDATILALAHKRYADLLRQSVIGLVETLQALLAVVDGETLGKSGRKRLLDGRMLLDNAAQEMRTAASANGPEPLDELCRIAEELRRTLCTRLGRLTGHLAKGIDDALVPAALFDSLRDHYQDSAALAAIHANRGLDAELLGYGRSFAALADEAWQLVDEEKDAQAMLDFDDLQLKAAMLLAQPDVRRKIAARLRFVMMDEFQDTNSLQYGIAQALTAGPNSDDAEDKPGANFFVVGDPKQSIYGFRGSDVRVFMRAQEDISAMNEKTRQAGQLRRHFTTPGGLFEATSEAEVLGGIRLLASFRLLPVIAAFVNRVCGQAMLRQRSEFDVAYEELVCGRQSAALSAPAGSISLLLARKQSADADSADDTGSAFAESGMEAEGSASPEEDLLADHLQQLVNGDQAALVWDYDPATQSEIPRPACYSDIAILARNRSGFEKLATALRRRDIPFVISGGRGFYDTQELLDMRSLLLFLQNPADDIALAASLRAPFFGIADTELFDISVCRGSSFWERARDYHSVYHKRRICTPHFLRAFRILNELLPLAARLPIPSLIRAILDRTGWRGLIAAEERAEQMEANIEKLLELARQFENKGFKNLYDFAEELQTLALYADTEGEAEISLGKDAVTIMTIHASKGLEFPIVALYKSNFSARRSQAPFLDKELGICFKLPAVNSEGLRQQLESPLSFLAARRLAQAEAAEELRVLYVALTRARDHLVVSGSVIVNEKGALRSPQGFLARICDGLGIDPGGTLYNTAVELQEELPILRDGNREVHDFSYRVLIRTDSAASAPPAAATEPAPAQVPPALLLPLQGVIVGDMYSASQIELFLNDPDEYERVYRLGLPRSGDEYWQRGAGDAAATDDEFDAVVGTLPGKLIHGTLERLKEWYDAEGDIRESDLEQVCQRVVEAGERPVSTELRERVLRECRAVAATDFVRAHAGKLDAFASEVPFQMPFGQDFLIGVVDALVPPAGGSEQTVEVWDWKTNRALSVVDMDALQEVYRIQLEVYLYFLALRSPLQQRYTARLLFTRRAAQATRPEDWIRTLQATPADIQRIETKIANAIRGIRALSYGLEG